MANRTNVNITLKITIYIPLYSITLPLNLRDTQNFLHFQLFCMIYKLISSWGPKNIPIRLKFTGITIRVGTFGPHNVGHTSTQTHTASVCIFIFYDWMVTIYITYQPIKGVSTVPTLYIS